MGKLLDRGKFQEAYRQCCAMRASVPTSKQPTTAELFPAPPVVAAPTIGTAPEPDRFYFELNLAEHTIFCIAKNAKRSRDVITHKTTQTINGQVVEVVWEVEPGKKHGYPGPFAIDVVYAWFRLAVKQRISRTQPRVSFLGLNNLLREMRKAATPQNRRLLKAALDSLGSVTLHATHTWLEAKTGHPKPKVIFQPFKISRDQNASTPQHLSAPYNWVQFDEHLVDQIEYNGLLLLLVKPEAFAELQALDKLLLPWLAKLLRFSHGPRIAQQDIAAIAHNLNIADSNPRRLRKKFSDSLQRVQTSGALPELARFQLSKPAGNEPVYLHLWKCHKPATLQPTSSEELLLQDIYCAGGSQAYRNRWLQHIRAVGLEGVHRGLSLHKQRLVEYRQQRNDVNPSKLLDTILVNDVPKLKEPARVE